MSRTCSPEFSEYPEIGSIGKARGSWFTAITSVFVAVARASASIPPQLAPGRRSADSTSGPGKITHMVNMERCSSEVWVLPFGCRGEYPTSRKSGYGFICRSFLSIKPAMQDQSDRDAEAAEISQSRILNRDLKTNKRTNKPAGQPKFFGF